MVSRTMPLVTLFFFVGLLNARGQTHECREVMVPMSDGVELATDVYLPTAHGPGPFPVVLTRTPYGKGDCEDTSGKYFAKHGYAAVSQDERGRHRSKGVYYWLRDSAWHERRDGYDTIEWAASQPWSNGKVGTMGSSFTCANQLLTAPTKPPHLRAMFCGEFASNPYRDLYYAGGALHMIMPTWLLTQREMVKPLPENVPGQGGYLGSGDSWLDWYERRQESGGSFDDNMFSRMYQDLIENPYYNDYWREFAIDEHYAEMDVPIFHLGGWYDRHVHGTVKHFNEIGTKGGPRARGAQKLFIGPWTHGAAYRGASLIGDIDFGPAAAIDYDALRKRWFDYHLKGIDNGIMEEPPVQIFVMGDNRWRAETEFPLKRAYSRELFLRSGGLLDDEPPKEEAPDRYDYDPRKPVPTIGGDLFVEPSGARDHRPAEKLSLTYTTAPLHADTEVTGRPKVELFASSSAVDTDWVVTISDVHPDGYSQFLRQNILRARYREGDRKPVLMEPGKVYRFAIDMYPISNVFKAGHRIRLTVASSSFPKWYPNGNTGREINEDFPPVVATNRIFHDREYPSRIALPFIPRDVKTQ
jgi:putative CocE/NonD family hydrolase